jgi:hypothetical protein
VLELIGAFENSFSGSFRDPRALSCMCYFGILCKAFTSHRCNVDLRLYADASGEALAERCAWNESVNLF